MFVAEPAPPRLFRHGAHWVFGLAVQVVIAMLLALPARAAEPFLQPEEAFRSDARPGSHRTIELHFEIAPGYYLYREQFRFDAAGARLGSADIPAGRTIFDETFGKQLETHRGALRIGLPVEQAAESFRLAVTFQGCSDQGLCYSPMQMRADVSLDANGGRIERVRVLPGREMPLPQSGGGESTTADEGRIEAALKSGRLAYVLAAFFVAGLLLSLTPCVLPMLPILSSIIVGQRSPVSRARAVALAASYSLGMAVVYTAFGVAAGLVGEGLAASLQNPLVLGGFAALLVVLALSSLGAYELALPSRVAGAVARVSQRMPGGQLGGVFVMGGLSALIVSPCVAAPLAGALVYLSQTRDVMLGAAALFSMAWGMSVPLLLMGASAGALLPRASHWMEDVKRFFGLLLFAMAIWTLQPVLPDSLSLGLWSALALFAAVLVLRGAVRQVEKPRRAGYAAAGAVLAVASVAELVGAATGASDPLRPLAGLVRDASPRGGAAALVFQPVRSSAELDAAIAAAKGPVVLDFYADWCVSCKEMERETFSVPAIRERLARAVLLKADVTHNTAADRELLRRFQLFGPPGTIFFDGEGREVAGSRVIGYQDSRRFEQTLDAARL